MDRGDNAEEMEGLHPFQVFPEELWPEIIEKLQDSAEIFKVIQAIPELKDIMESSKRWWLFGQVLPHVSHWLKRSDFLSCRQVCRLWSHGVDNLLENHPRYRAYNPEEPVTGQVWIHEMKPASFHAWNFFFPVMFNGRDKLDRFVQGMRNHPKGRNPIVGRAVVINTKQDMKILTEVSEAFQSLGQHVWYVKLEDYIHADPIPFSNAIREWIGLLQNLKCLRLQTNLRTGRRMVVAGFHTVTYVDDDEEYFAKPKPGPSSQKGKTPDPWMEPLPPLPHLESLQFIYDTLPPSMVNALVSSYSLQIRRLWLPLRYWKPGFYTMLPNLTELYINYIFSKPRLLHILLNLQAPLLYELEVVLEDIIQLDVETEILPWLKRFPHIRNLTLSSGPGLPGGNVALDHETNSVPSLKYLDVPGAFMHANSDLLLCFPNLEYLHLSESSDPLAWAFMDTSVKIWKDVENQTIYESNVWELMPNLKVVTLTDIKPIRFTREMLEHRNKVQDDMQ